MQVQGSQRAAAHTLDFLFVSSPQEEVRRPGFCTASNLGLGARGKGKSGLVFIVAGAAWKRLTDGTHGLSK